MNNYGTFPGAGMVLWIVVWWLAGLLAIALLRLFPHIPLKKPAHITQTSQEGSPSEQP
jgi:hypothetical protein